MAEFVALKGDSRAALKASVQRVRGQFASMAPELEKANKASVEWLGNRAAEILNDRVDENDRSPSTARTAGRLRNAIAQGKIATFDESGFRWGVARLLNATSAGVYWREIEQGAQKFVGRPYHVKVFPFGGSHSEVKFRMVGRRTAQGERGPGGRFLPGWVSEGGPRIRRPIPAYHYLSEAVADFLSQDVYAAELAKASEQWRKVLATAKRRGVSPKAVRGG